MGDGKLEYSSIVDGSIDSAVVLLGHRNTSGVTYRPRTSRYSEAPTLSAPTGPSGSLRLNGLAAGPLSRPPLVLFSRPAPDLKYVRGNLPLFSVAYMTAP